MALLLLTPLSSMLSPTYPSSGHYPYPVKLLSKSSYKLFLHSTNFLARKSSLTVRASSETGEEAVPVESLPLESKQQMILEQREKMKLAKKIRLRRKRLVRKRRMRKKGRWPPSKVKKNKNV